MERNELEMLANDGVALENGSADRVEVLDDMPLFGC